MMNAWQRLWLITAVIWGLVCLGSVTFLVIENLGQAPLAAYIAVGAALALAIWFIPLIALYVVGWLIAWVLREIRE